MIMRRIMVSLVLLCCLLGTASQAATTVVSTVDTKTGVRFHGENPNKLGQDVGDTPHKGKLEGLNHKGTLPQTGEVKTSFVYKISGSLILVSGIIAYFFNKKNKDVS